MEIDQAKGFFLFSTAESRALGLDMDAWPITESAALKSAAERSLRAWSAHAVFLAASYRRHYERGQYFPRLLQHEQQASFAGRVATNVLCLLEDND